MVARPAAPEDIAEACEWLAEGRSRGRVSLAGRLQQVRDFLSEMARRFPICNHPSRSGEVRGMVHGRGRNRYRVLHLIDADAVSILCVPHAARRKRR